MLDTRSGGAGGGTISLVPPGNRLSDTGATRKVKCYKYQRLLWLLIPPCGGSHPLAQARFFAQNQSVAPTGELGVEPEVTVTLRNQVLIESLRTPLCSEKNALR